MMAGTDSVTYAESADGVKPEQLLGFFADWATMPSSDALLRILLGSSHVVLAVQAPRGRVVGLVTAISDGVSAAYIPHLEVLPQWRGQGIGSQLIRRMLARLQHLYVVDLMCDPELQPFYERFGMRPYTGMIVKNYARQSCEPRHEMNLRTDSDG